MKLKDFDFRIWDKHHKGCGNKDCKCQTKYVYGNEAKIRLSEFKEDCEIELWTGFYDKNGNKIYEGDVLRNERFDEYYHVYRNDRYNTLRVQMYGEISEGVLHKKEDSISVGFLKTLPSNEFMEVIGNVRENKELLGDKSETE